MSAKNIFTEKKSIGKKLVSLVLVLAIVGCLCGGTSAYATGSSTTTTADPDADVPLVTVPSNSQETLGTVGFAQSNTKRISVGKSTVLYLTIKDMGYSYATTFESSDETIATVTLIDNRAAKVVGLKSGVVTITATVDSTKGIKVAEYELTIGEADGSSDVTTEEEPENDTNNVGIITDYDDTDLDLFSSTEDPMLAAYAKERNSNNATSILLGLIGWVLIIMSIVYVFSVIIRSRTPKMNVSPGSRRRYSAGSSGSLRSGNRLLPNKYYRNMKKY